MRSSGKQQLQLLRGTTQKSIMKPVARSEMAGIAKELQLEQSAENPVTL